MLRSLIAAALALAVLSSVAEARPRRAPTLPCGGVQPCADFLHGVRSISITMKRDRRRTKPPVYRAPKPVAPPNGRVFTGMASFYGNESGSKTASGQRFNQNAMTAAHRTLPFGTKLKVTHGSQSVVVTINDRGPFIKGRVLDLSTGAARAVGLTSRGVGHIVAEVL